MFSLHSSTHFQKIGISSLIFLSGMGSVFAAPATPSGETDGGKFSLYFKNIADTDCAGGNVLTGFSDTPGNGYLLKECMSIGPIIGAFFSTQPTAPVGTAITGFNLDGSPTFGQASQWVGNVPGNIYYTGGNVGIGTNIPLTKLDVFSGSIMVRSGKNISNTNHEGVLFSTNNPAYYAAILANQGTATSRLGLSFFTSNNTVPTEAMRITPAGNLGIGTTSPLGTEKILIELPQSSWGLMLSRSGAKIGGIHTNDGVLTFQNLSNAKIYLSGANVGIGTSTPNTKFEVAGQISSTNSTAFRSVYGNYGAMLYNNGSSFYILSTASGSQYGNYNSFRPFTYNFASGTVFLANSAITALSSGNVGLGNTNPTEKLTVNGNMNLNGQVIGGFGASAAGGTLDWNDPTNARSGNGYTLLTGNAVNGPVPSGAYYHPFSFEYNSKNGGGNMTQFAIPYNSSSLNAGMYMRTRYSNTWTNWSRIISENTSGNVGIGTIAPGAKLTINNSGATQPTLSIGDNGVDNTSTYGMVNLTRPADTARASLAFIRQGNYVWQMGYIPNTNYFGVYKGDLTSNGTPVMTFGSNGNVAIGTGTVISGIKLNVDGRIKALGSSIFAQNDNTSTSYDKAAIQIREAQYGGNNTFLAPRMSFHWGNTNSAQIGLDINGRISILKGNGTEYANLIANTIYGSNYYYTSDKRLKKDIIPIVSPLEKIKALSGYTFSWKDTGAKSVGLIAQEVEKIFPELVGETQTASGMTIKTVQYGNLVAPLIESVKELSRLHDEDQKKIEDLKSEVEEMKKDIEFLRSQIKK